MVLKFSLCAKLSNLFQWNNNNNNNNNSNYSTLKEVRDDGRQRTSAAAFFSSIDVPNQIVCGGGLGIKRNCCWLKHICHFMNTAEPCCCARQKGLRHYADLVLIQCGQWRDVLVGKASNCGRDSNALTSIRFEVPSINKSDRRKISYSQLLDNFRFNLAIIDVQLLNADTIERMALARLRADNLVLLFRNRPEEWPVRRYYPLLRKHLASSNTVAHTIVAIFPGERNGNDSPPEAFRVDIIREEKQRRNGTR